MGTSPECRHQRLRDAALSHMLFALACELIVWETMPGWKSLMESGYILGSVFWVGIKKEERADIAKVRAVDEEVGLMSGEVEGEEGEEGNEWMEMEGPAASWGLDGHEDCEEEEGEG
ncbi:hypothetical protein B9Z19DRAFT_1128336 [Tuber borchii]|uniref:Uncharacterized protein n=1 Tax=Tuber borchii TaxID=42251 RepID=A0A2T6ZPT0_TUBBO|nr:hypothetical protein B9Z19DRAFT_1128336 [Tuber borchii]